MEEEEEEDDDDDEECPSTARRADAPLADCASRRDA